MSDTDPLIRWIGQFHDTNYGTDDVGQLFATIAEAKDFLQRAYHSGYWANITKLLPTGEYERSLMPAVTEGAILYLWRMPDDVHLSKIRAHVANGGDPTAFADGVNTRLTPDSVDWVIAIGKRNRAVQRSVSEYLNISTEERSREVRDSGLSIVNRKE